MVDDTNTCWCLQALVQQQVPAVYQQMRCAERFSPCFCSSFSCPCTSWRDTTSTYVRHLCRLYAAHRCAQQYWQYRRSYRPVLRLRGGVTQSQHRPLHWSHVPRARPPTCCRVQTVRSTSTASRFVPDLRQMANHQGHAAVGGSDEKRA